ncbi:MAG TPA: AMP-binding protein [Candidatus Acidoferrum sp.]|nr:AMP-binding protein [Candidatus Acidoferrum sp.]
MTPRPLLASLVRGDVPGVVWPPVSSGTSATLAALVLHLEATQWMAPPELAASQHRQLVVVAEHAARHAPLFRRRLARAHVEPRDLLSPDGLRKVPLLHRRDLQSAGPELYCTDVPPSHLPLEETRTSGSTGEPVVVKRTAVDQLFWSAMTIRDHLWHERDVGKGLSVIRATIQSYSRVASWGPPMSTLFATGPSQRIPITTSAEQQLDWLAAFKPNNLVIYPASLDALARFCGQRQVVLPGLQHIRTIGETLPPAVRALASAAFGAKVEDVYSSQEMGVIAIECPSSGLYHVMAEALIVEVVDDAGRTCKDGEVGRVVATALHNFATPLIRYDIGDYAEVAGPCPCGRGLPTLRRILGRERNLIVMPDGTRHWPLVGFHRFQEIGPIRQYQFIQHDRERIEVRLVSEAPLSAAQEAELSAVIQDALGHPFVLSFTYFAGAIPRGPGGKFEEFVCNVPNQLTGRS